MISVTKAVTQVVENSDFAWKGLRGGLLNVTAYARLIRPEIERLTKKQLDNDSSIVMALSRYGRELRKTEAARPSVDIVRLSSRSNLVEMAYPTTPEVRERLAMLSLLESVRNAPDFLSVTGPNSVIVIVDAPLAEVVKGHFGTISPVIERAPLASITLETADAEAHWYEALESLETRGVSVIEHVSGPRTLTVIVGEKDAGRAYGILHGRLA